MHCYEACGLDRYPKNYPKSCKVAYTCPKLAARKACSKRFNQILPKACFKKLSKWAKNQLVKSFCKKSCHNCTGKHILFAIVLPPLMHNIISILRNLNLTFLFMLYFRLIHEVHQIMKKLCI